MNEKETALLKEMQSISKKCWDVDWYPHIPYDLWFMLESGQQSYGDSFVSNRQLKNIRKLAFKAQVWFIDPPMPIPLMRWMQAVQQYRQDKRK
jgi:hypothetical protein